MIKRINVMYLGIQVGTLALTNDRQVAFQYSSTWIKNGFSISPFKLPLTDQVFISTSQYFKGLFGVFGDSLPDSYGELLLERFLRSKDIDIRTLSCLDRLAYIGSNGMGALEYVPDYSYEIPNEDIDLDLIQKECDSLLNSKEVSDISSLYSLGGSSGGARPKSLISYEGCDYIVKFSSKFDPKNIAEQEYNYMRMARDAGINIPEIKLVKSKTQKNYFMIKRFDRDNGEKIHMISAAALLECDFRAPCLDYNDLIRLTSVLTSSYDDVLEMFRRMVFNVLIDNQDDHAKNFSYIYDRKKRKYCLAPAYDITRGQTYYGEHTTSVNGKGCNITDDDFMKVAIKNKIDLNDARSIIDKIKTIIKR